MHIHHVQEQRLFEILAPREVIPFSQFSSLSSLKNSRNFIVRIAISADLQYAKKIASAMSASATKRGTSIPPRNAAYVAGKIYAGLAVIAIEQHSGEWAGFSCLEVWQHEKYVAHAGLIVSEKFRGSGISRTVKNELFQLSREKFPGARVFSLSSSPAVKKLNVESGYKVLPFSELLSDELFLNGSNSWVNYYAMMDERHAAIGYEAMVFEPAEHKEEACDFNFLTTVRDEQPFEVMLQ